MKLIKTSLTLLAATLPFAPLQQADAEVLYRNTFGNDTGATIATNHPAIGWQLYRSSVSDQHRALVYSAVSSSASGVGISAVAGVEDTIGNVNAPDSLSATLGHGFLTTTATEDRKALYFTEYLIERTAYNIESFEWDAVVSRADTGQRLALRVGDEWYVSDLFKPVVSSSFANAGGATQISVTLAGTSWYQLTVQLSNPFAIANSPSALPDGDISAFGLFIEAGLGASNTSRFDNFTVQATAIPEGSTVGLLLSSAGVALLGGWRGYSRR